MKSYLSIYIFIYVYRSCTYRCYIGIIQRSKSGGPTSVKRARSIGHVAESINTLVKIYTLNPKPRLLQGSSGVPEALNGGVHAGDWCCK